MPGPVSQSSRGPGPRTPYVPSWVYPDNSPKMCPCGHHEGYHGGPSDVCLLAVECGCRGLPEECKTADEKMYGYDEEDLTDEVRGMGDRGADGT